MGRELVPATGVALAGEYGAVPGRRYGSGGGSYLLVDHHSCGGGSLCAGKCGGDLNSGEGAGPARCCGGCCWNSLVGRMGHINKR